jgi:putative transposase
MPRGPRLDAPGALHHVMVRGIERRLLFHDDTDRADFVARLAEVVRRTELILLAWALLPNHLHLLVRTPPAPSGRPYRPVLPAAMRRLLTGYAGAFNRRHKRVGHLVQNRYRSTLVEEDSYLLELVRYLHLNPLRAGVVRDIAALQRYPWSGHSAILGRIDRPWQASTEVLAQFGTGQPAARRRYRDFVAAGEARGRRAEFQGGGLRRSAGGWREVAALRRGREHWAADERILGSGAFVEAILREAEPPNASWPPPQALAALPVVFRQCADLWGVELRELQHGSRRRRVVQARAVVATLAVVHLGLPAAQVARQLAVTPAAVRRGMEQGTALLRAARVDPERLLRTLKRQVS